MNSTALIWLVALPLVAGPAVYLVGRLQCWMLDFGFWMPSRSIQHPTPAIQGGVARWLALAALAGAWLPLALAARELASGGAVALAVGAVALRLDGLGLLVAALALALGGLVALFSGPDLAGRVGEEKYYALVVVLVGTLIGLACAGDLFNLWVWFELTAVVSYVLVAFYHRQPAALEAGVKYLLQGTAGSVLALLGIALVLAQAGTLDLAQIHARAAGSPALLAAGALLLVGFGVKAALVPLHAWLPDAYEQAPSGVSAIMSAVVTKAGLVALLRALGALAGVTLSWGTLLIGFGALNILAGNLLALRQTQVKRLLAYSSLGQLGYIFLGLGIGVYAGQAAGAQGGLFHLLTHALMSALAFLAVGALIYSLGGAARERGSLVVGDLAGAARRYPLAALALSVAALGLAGLPPLAGFMSKWQIFVAGFATRSPAIMALVVFAALNSVLSLAYYAPLVNAVYRLEPSAAVRRGQALPAAMRAPLGLLALAVLALGVWPGLAAWLTGPAGAAVMAAFGR